MTGIISRRSRRMTQMWGENDFKPMSKEQTKDLLKFLKPFSGDIQEIVWWLRAFVWDLYPQTNELIYDNYNALAFGWSPTDKVGHTITKSISHIKRTLKIKKAKKIEKKRE